MNKFNREISLITSVLLVFLMSIGCHVNVVAAATTYKSVQINGLDIFYREAGPVGAPTILLLHGYPTSSHMFRNLMRDLSDEYHLLAPDCPGFGRSEQPLMSEFDYTFDNISKIMEGVHGDCNSSCNRELEQTAAMLFPRVAV